LWPARVPGGRDDRHDDQLYRSSCDWRGPQTDARLHEQRDPSASIRTTTASFGTLWPTTRPSPSGVLTRVPTAGADAWNFWYNGCLHLTGDSTIS